MWKKSNWADLLVLVSLLTSAWVFSTGVGAPFYRDDAAHIKQNTALHGPTFTLKELNESAHGTTKYLTMLSYRAAWLAGDGESWPFHFMSLLLHLLNGIALYVLLRHLLPQHIWVAALTTMLFLLHPMQVNPVMYASKFAILLSSFFILIGLNVAARAPIGKEPVWAILGLSVLGMLAKEAAVLLPILALIYRRLVVYGSTHTMPRRQWLPYVGMVTGLVLVYAVLNGLMDQKSYGFHVQPAHEYFLTQMYNGWRYLLLVFFALSRSHIHPHPLFDQTVIWYGLGFMACAAITIYFLLRYTKRRDAVLFLLLFFVVLLAPTHSFIAKRSAFAEYQFYLPNAATYGVILFVGWQLLARWSYALPALALLLLGSLSYSSYFEVKNWKDPMDLAMQSAKQYPRDSTVSCMMAEKANLCGDKKLASELTLQYYKGEHEYYRFDNWPALQAKFDFLMKKEEHAELYRQLKITREKYKRPLDAGFYQYFLYALRANNKKEEYEIEVKAARKAFPGTPFLDFAHQLHVRELIRRNPAYWDKVD